MNKLHLYTVMLLLFISGTLAAQQDPAYTFYRYNMNFINPAHAGAESRTEFGANIRSQWSGVVGAPETQSFMASTYFGKNVGLGISIINDKTFIENQTSVALDFSYHLKWDDDTNIYLGLKASGNSYNANTDGLMTFGIESDLSLMNLNGGVTPNIGIGVYLQAKKLSLSFSAPRILKPERLEQDGATAKLGRNKMHMYLMGVYDIEINDNLVLKPATLIRHVESAPLSVDLTLTLNYNSLLEFGSSYRINEGFSGLFIFDLSKGMKVGYAYEVSKQSSLANTNNGTHEIMLKLEL
ncbi:type IX secretion system membrane protein PorP/SprF [uncultured Maribacter sp.]|uniref:PorP/SprF family type IX secretion system membrane protein n=1 Tax=uncultured Maribacter sp. TaxID=431308 RepID=UPI0030DC8E9B